jgi:2-C-methyl-D-erythritol 4-phosphate cytidylyltransferase
MISSIGKGEEDSMNVALILAGGLGSRVNGDVPKQFMIVHDKPVIIYTLEKFEQSSLIDEICVVCVEGWTEKLTEYCQQFNITKCKHICVGGDTGLQSVLNGLKQLKNISDEDMILIHDGVRPFLDPWVIAENLNVAYEYGVAMTSIPCVETLVFSENGVYADKCISRDHLRSIQTPQTFKAKILRDLFRMTDVSASLQPSAFAFYMSTGQPIYCSEGSQRNVKLTYPKDVESFADWFK